MDSISSFINTIISFQINLPIWLKAGFIIFLIMAFVVGGYFLKDTFDMPAIQSGYSWFITIAIINLLSILAIFIFYGQKMQVGYKGSSGIRGKKGKRGKKGVSTTCSYECKRNIYLQSVRRTDIICRLDTYNPDFKSIYIAYNYFQKIINEGNEIDYSGMINHIILGKSIGTLNQVAISNFQNLMSSNSIAWYLIKLINTAITTSSDKTYGTFRSVVPKVGYLAIGDSVYGGNEGQIALNSFVVSGDIMYPNGYTKLTSVQAFNEKTQEQETFTVWRPNSQTSNFRAFDGSIEKHEYLPLGDVCSFGTTPPKEDDFALIKDSCLDPVPINDLKLVFIYTGALSFKSDVETQKYKQESSYLIDNLQTSNMNDIEIFSVWRTPMNTFICNFNSENDLVNESLYYNLLFNLEEAINEYGNISTKYKKWIVDMLSHVQLPSILIAMIYTRYFELEALKELIYYINKYQATVPNFQNLNKDISSMSIAELMKLIAITNEQNQKFNKNLIKQASISLRATKPLVYDQKQERHLPDMILKIYNQITEMLDTIPIKVANSSNLLDIVNTVIPNGLEGRIAVNSDGIAQGGILLNEIQEIIIRMCKILMPPTGKAYVVKDECLGTFSLDKEKRDLVKQLTNVKVKVNKFMDIFATENTKYKSQEGIIRIYEEFAFKKIGNVCGHITNYQKKIDNLDMEEITPNRIKLLIKIYEELSHNLEEIIKNTPS